MDKSRKTVAIGLGVVGGILLIALIWVWMPKSAKLDDAGQAAVAAAEEAVKNEEPAAPPPPPPPKRGGAVRNE